MRVLSSIIACFCDYLKYICVIMSARRLPAEKSGAD